MQLLGYSVWLLGWCYLVVRLLGVVTSVVAMVPGVVARVLLCGC